MVKKRINKETINKSELDKAVKIKILTQAEVSHYFDLKLRIGHGNRNSRPDGAAAKKQSVYDKEHTRILRILRPEAHHAETIAAIEGVKGDTEEILGDTAELKKGQADMKADLSELLVRTSNDPLQRPGETLREYIARMRLSKRKLENEIGAAVALQRQSTPLASNPALWDNVPFDHTKSSGDQRAALVAQHVAQRHQFDEAIALAKAAKDDANKAEKAAEKAAKAAAKAAEKAEKAAAKPKAKGKGKAKAKPPPSTLRATKRVETSSEPGFAAGPLASEAVS